MSRKHGASLYRNYGCRCDTCRRGNTERARVERANRRGRTPPEHGYGGYNNYGCRCTVCFTAHSIRMKEYRAERAQRCRP